MATKQEVPTYHLPGQLLNHFCYTERSHSPPCARIAKVLIGTTAFDKVVDRFKRSAIVTIQFLVRKIEFSDGDGSVTVPHIFHADCVVWVREFGEDFDGIRKTIRPRKPIARVAKAVPVRRDQAELFQ